MNGTGCFRVCETYVRGIGTPDEGLKKFREGKYDRK